MVKLTDFFKRLACCSCMQNNEAGGIINEKITISIKNTCCKRTKSINIHIDKNNIESIEVIKEIMDRIEHNISNKPKKQLSDNV